jgi:hypothetical protein
VAVGASISDSEMVVAWELLIAGLSIIDDSSGEIKRGLGVALAS